MDCSTLGPCPSPSPEVCLSSCALHQWCHPAVSSSDSLFSCPQFFPASGTFPVSHLFIRGYWYFSQQSWFQLVLHPIKHFSWCTLHTRVNKQDDNIQLWRTPISYLEPVCCSMSSSNCCFLTCIQISQEAGQGSGIPISFRIFHSLLWST